MATFAFMMPFFRLSAIFLAVVAVCASLARAAPLFPDDQEPSTTTTTAQDVAARGVAAGPYAGDLTFYYPGGNYGSCGTPLQNGDKVVALAAAFFDQYTPNGNPNRNTLCGKQIEVTTSGRKTVATVADRCAACVGRDVDLTSSSFQALVPGGLAVGRTKATWRFLN